MHLIISDKNKVKQFELIFKYLKNISIDINLNFTKDGLYTQGMCGSHVSLFELNLEKDWFKEYDTENDMTIGVNCEMLFKCINCLEETQSIRLESKGQDSLKLYFSGEKTITKEFVLPLMNIDIDIMEIPDVEYSADITILSEQFESLISELDIFGKTVSIKCDENYIELEALGDMGNMNVKIKEEDIIEYALEENEDEDENPETEFCKVLQMSYGLEHLKNIILFSKLNKQMKMHISAEFPIKFHYNLDNWTDNIDDEDESDSVNFIKFFVAPQVEDF